MTEHPLHDLAMTIRYDLTAAQGKLTELLRQIGELDVPEPGERFSFMNGPVTADQCESCGVGGGNHSVDCQKLHLEIYNRWGSTAGGAAVARAHTPSPEATT